MFLSPPLPPTPDPGTMGGLFLDGDESPALEDISKWTVEDVCSFVSNLAGCTEYTQVMLRAGDAIRATVPMGTQLGGLAALLRHCRQMGLQQQHSA